jgi:hypothetical protein
MLKGEATRAPRAFPAANLAEVVPNQLSKHVVASEAAARDREGRSFRTGKAWNNHVDNAECLARTFADSRVNSFARVQTGDANLEMKQQSELVADDSDKVPTRGKQPRYNDLGLKSGMADYHCRDMGGQILDS